MRAGGIFTSLSLYSNFDVKFVRRHRATRRIVLLWHHLMKLFKLVRHLF